MQLVSLGVPASVAAKRLGFTSQAVSMRRKRNKVFNTAMEQAEAGAQIGLISCVMKAAPKDYRAAMGMLERRWPELYARPEIRAELNVTSISAAEIVDGIHKGLKLLAAQHAPFDEPDVDADQPPPPGPDAVVDEFHDVTRS